MSTYDEIPYPTHPFPQAHVDRLATHAALFGMRPAPLDSCRVLELGCGDGGHLIPMAYNFPHAEFVGVDSAARAVAAGRAVAGELGLGNLRLLHAGIEEIGGDLGPFDYVIAHGVYSWVPPAVRDKIMSVCGERLTPHGVAYVSYNALPGGHVRQMTREMMRWHVRGLSGPAERVGRAQEFLTQLAGAVGESSPFAPLLAGEMEKLKALRPNHVVHDDLAEVNEFFYFHQFVGHAARHGLTYLAEADFADMAEHSMSAQAAGALRRWADDPLEREQYADFLKWRRFRQTLLCRGEVSPDRDPSPERLTGLYVSAPLRPLSPQPDVRSDAPEQFQGASEAKVTTGSPLVKAAALLLGERWPQVVGFGELLRAARSRAGLSRDAEGAAEDERLLAGAMLEAYKIRLVMLHSHRPQFVSAAGVRPCVSRLARVQLRHGSLVASQRHEGVEIRDEMGRALIQLLDGTRTRDVLVEELSSRVRSGTIGPDPAGASPQSIIDGLPADLESSLGRLAANALLVG